MAPFPVADTANGAVAIYMVNQLWPFLLSCVGFWILFGVAEIKAIKKRIPAKHHLLRLLVTLANMALMGYSWFEWITHYIINNHKLGREVFPGEDAPLWFTCICGFVALIILGGSMRARIHEMDSEKRATVNGITNILIICAWVCLSATMQLKLPGATYKNLPGVDPRKLPSAEMDDVQLQKVWSIVGSISGGLLAIATTMIVYSLGGNYYKMRQAPRASAKTTRRFGAREPDLEMQSLEQKAGQPAAQPATPPVRPRPVHSSSYLYCL